MSMKAVKMVFRGGFLAGDTTLWEVSLKTNNISPGEGWGVLHLLCSFSFLCVNSLYSGYLGHCLHSGPISTGWGRGRIQLFHLIHREGKPRLTQGPTKGKQCRNLAVRGGDGAGSVSVPVGGLALSALQPGLWKT